MWCWHTVAWIHTGGHDFDFTDVSCITQTDVERLLFTQLLQQNKTYRGWLLGRLSIYKVKIVWNCNDKLTFTYFCIQMVPIYFLHPGGVVKVLFKPPLSDALWGFKQGKICLSWSGGAWTPFFTSQRFHHMRFWDATKTRTEMAMLVALQTVSNGISSWWTC